MTNKKQLLDDMIVPLHYILKLGDDFYHQYVNCTSIEDMEHKALTLEEKFDPMEISIRVNKKKLVIGNVTTKSNAIENIEASSTRTLPKHWYTKTAPDQPLDTGIFFNPSLAKQLNVFRAEVNRVDTVEELLVEKPFEGNPILGEAEDFLDEDPSEATGGDWILTGNKLDCSATNNEV